MASSSSSRGAKSSSSAFLLLLGFIVFLQWGGKVTALSSDGQALLTLKSSMVDTGGKLDDWVLDDSFSTTPCNWTGIQCDGDDNVVSLNVSHFGLTGSFSGAIGALKHLISLSLDSNDLSGPLPQELTSLTHLRFFNITNNNFISAFPIGLSNLTKLEVLDCYNNNLSGVLPVEITSLRSLRHVHLGGNSFERSIPPEYGSFGENLDYLALSGNALTGFIPPELGNLTGLTQLYLGWWNVYSGGIPAEFGRLGNLKLLDLASCKLTGSIPRELANLTMLESVFLFMNQLSGPLPAELGTLTNLLSFDISGNFFTGTIPDSFAGLLNVKLLNFFENKFGGEMPAFLGDLPSLEDMQFWSNDFVGSIPVGLGRNGNFLRMDVSDNHLMGGLPPDLCAGGRLKILIAKNNSLNGPIPEGIANCISLEYIRLHDNLLSGMIPAPFLTFPLVQTMWLNNNLFEGPIPSVVNASVLRLLDFSNNHLSSTIPEAIGDLQALQTMHLEGNHLTGSIPSRICDIPGLYEIDLGTNLLNGSIPPSLGNCSMLSKLILSSNNLTGEIPFQLVNLSVLAILDLSRNDMSGRIPEEFGLIKSLTQVDFSYNNFSGPIPTAEAMNYNESSFLGNPLLCGAPLAPCAALAPGPSVTNITSKMKTVKRKEPSLLAWLVGAIFSSALLVLLIGMCCFFRKYRFFILRMLRKEGTVRPWKFTPFQRLDFTAAEIVECLNEENIIGRGGAGTVYRGEMSNGEMVAVKRLACVKGSSSYDHGFSAEIRTLGKIRHRYIVRLLGFCTNNEVNLLVYEYMPNGSLGEFLHDAKKSGLLDWSTRYNIALQAATGLCYLHHDCSPLIVHRDVKSNNILLDTNLEAHVADFGLAKLFQDSGKSESMSSIAGSYGYIAPEYAYTLKVNEKSDIYSFGVVLMELLTGKRPIEPEFGDGVDIVQWARAKIQTKEGVLEILDPRIGGVTTVVPLQEVMLVLRVALLCSSDHPVDRPTMRDVVQMLSDVRPSSAVRNCSMDSRELKSQEEVLVTDDLLTF